MRGEGGGEKGDGEYGEGRTSLVSISKGKYVDGEYTQENDITYAREVIDILLTLFKDNVEIRILKALSKNSPCSLRRLARYVGIHHTNLSRYIAKLVDLGLIEQESVGRMRIIRLKGKYTLIRNFF